MLPLLEFQELHRGRPGHPTILLDIPHNFKALRNSCNLILFCFFLLLLFERTKKVRKKKWEKLASKAGNFFMGNVWEVRLSWGWNFFWKLLKVFLLILDRFSPGHSNVWMCVYCMYRYTVWSRVWRLYTCVVYAWCVKEQSSLIQSLTKEGFNVLVMIIPSHQNSKATHK